MSTRGRRDPFAGLQTGVTLNWVIGTDQLVPDIPRVGAVMDELARRVFRDAHRCGGARPISAPAGA